VENTVLEKLRRVKVQHIVTVLAISMSLFQLYTGLMGSLEPLLQRLIHMAFGLTLAYLGGSVIANTQNYSRKAQLIDNTLKWILLFTWLVYLGYFFDNYTFLSSVRFPYIQPLSYFQVFIGTAMAIVVLDTTRRLLGWSLVWVAFACIAYALAGKWLPGILHHSGYSWNVIIDNLAFTTDGIIGIPIAISATYIVLFVIFTTFLSQIGFGELMLNLALGLAGKLRGGPGKVSVIANGMMGMISGSAVACTLAVGSITLPLMEKTGYKKEFAAGAVAVGGCGGQIMPPVMGAQAFLMSQFTGIPYIGIAKLSLIPAILYYTGIWFALDIEARKGEGKGKKLIFQLPKGWGREVLLRIHLVIPMILLVVFLMSGYTPMLSVVYSIIFMIVVSFFRRETRLNVPKTLKALEDGALLSLSVVCATAVSGIIIGTLTMTGIGERFSFSILTLAGGNVLLALIFAMIVSLLLGLGLPTVPAYIIQVSMVIPALVKLGLPVYVAHMFAVYYACLSMITPPEAVPAYAAAGLVKANPATVGWLGFAIGAPAYLIPFLFVYRPGLLMVGSVFEIVYALIIAFAMVFALSLSIWGYWHKALSWPERILSFLSVIFLIYAQTSWNIIGMAMLAGLLYWQRRFRLRKHPAFSYNGDAEG
jgi:TRAP transporter 4TM/12TM fusion protein